MTERPEDKREHGGRRPGLPERLACSLLPYRQDGERVPWSYMDHRLGLFILVLWPFLLGVAAIAAARADWWVVVPAAVLGIGSMATSALLAIGVRRLRALRRESSS
ncbi:MULTISPECIES: hypothetical protein [Streptomyces]|uniref:Integral membrane protein n=3 Tax=Streptomyces TaxID=1883 RepID=A0A1E7LG69_9ACTN|nr:hypothetical protein [Streptomyces nanshensis]OEV15168.1 hypothetical protein AN221_40215 [Streptomyces nanshensis]QCW77967.1 hypothetical protein EQG64_12670 [Streptomyces sp. S6]